jgi:seryl-tRNA synthetase
MKTYGIDIETALQKVIDNQMDAREKSATIIANIKDMHSKIEQLEEDVKSSNDNFLEVIKKFTEIAPQIEKIGLLEEIILNHKEPKKSLQWQVADSSERWKRFDKYRWLLVTGVSGLTFTTIGLLIKQIIG